MIIYVQLLGDDIGTFRPTEAIDLGNEKYQLLATADYNPEDEEWEFLPGDIVSVTERVSENGTYLAAVALSP